MRRLLPLPLVALAALLAVGCSDLGDPVSVTDPGDGEPEAVSFTTDVLPLLQVCAGCHAFSQSWAGLVGVPADGYGGALRVAAGDSTLSVLYQKLRGNADFGGQMPLGLTPLDDAGILTIGRWIEEGAPDN